MDDDEGLSAASNGKEPNCAAVAFDCLGDDKIIGPLVRKYCPRRCGLCGLSHKSKRTLEDQMESARRKQKRVHKDRRVIQKYAKKMVKSAAGAAAGKKP